LINHNWRILIDLEKLRTFVDLAATLNFSQTAINLFINQSTVSKHIQALEKEFGCQLFVRTNRQVRLSSPGSAILATTRQLVQLDQQLHLELQASQATINLVTIPTFINYPIFQAIEQYQAISSRSSPPINGS